MCNLLTISTVQYGYNLNYTGNNLHIIHIIHNMYLLILKYVSTVQGPRTRPLVAVLISLFSSSTFSSVWILISLNYQYCSLHCWYWDVLHLLLLLLPLLLYSHLSRLLPPHLSLSLSLSCLEIPSLILTRTLDLDYSPLTLTCPPQR